MNPYVFIVGCPRSGTTLARRMVDAHPEIAITRETHWIPAPVEKGIGLTSDGFVTSELLEWVGEQRRFPKLGIAETELERLVADGEPVSYSAFVTALFDLYGKKQQKRLVGDKTPPYVRHLQTLHALWPNARIVHIIRDGREVCLSAINWKRRLPSFERRFPTWKSDPVTTAALWWEGHVRAGREDGHALARERYYELRYEHFVANPEEACAHLCAFLGVPYDDAMPRFHEGRTKTDPGLSAKKAWLPATAGLRDWRMQMPFDDVARFEAAAGPLLEELGYERAVARPPKEALDRASAARPSVAQQVARKAIPSGITLPVRSPLRARASLP